jgi:hypothetical protein
MQSDKHKKKDHETSLLYLNDTMNQRPLPSTPQDKSMSYSRLVDDSRFGDLENFLQTSKPKDNSIIENFNMTGSEK